MNEPNPAPVTGKRIKVQKVPSASKRLSTDEILAQVCYHYPQYNLEEAKRLSYRQVKLLLKTAAQQQAIQMYNLTQIVAAPHTKKGAAVTKLSEHFKKLANS